MPFTGAARKPSPSLFLQHRGGLGLPLPFDFGARTDAASTYVSPSAISPSPSPPPAVEFFYPVGVNHLFPDAVDYVIIHAGTLAATLQQQPAHHCSSSRNTDMPGMGIGMERGDNSMRSIVELAKLKLALVLVLAHGLSRARLGVVMDTGAGISAHALISACEGEGHGNGEAHRGSSDGSIITTAAYARGAHSAAFVQFLKPLLCWGVSGATADGATFSTPNATTSSSL